MHFSLINIIALCFVVPTYIIFFISKEPVIQGLAYSLYWIPFFFYVYRNGLPKVSLNFIIIWTLFLALWIFPSIFNYYSRTLESDLVKLPILFFHVGTLTAIIITFKILFSSAKQNTLEELFVKMCLVILPIAILIFLKSLYLFSTSDVRPHPFNIHPNVATEISLVTLILATQLKQQLPRLLIYAMVLATCYLCDSRGALLSCIIILSISFVLPKLLKITAKKKLLWALVCLLPLLFFSQEIYEILKELLLLNKRTANIASRLDVWIFALDSITQHPWSGIGFWVHPFGYSLPQGFFSHGPQYEIHNAFLRIATENGLGLLILILFIILLAIRQLLIGKNFTQLGITIGILFFLFFATRHLTLNLLNILLYLILVTNLMRRKVVR